MAWLSICLVFDCDKEHLEVDQLSYVALRFSLCNDAVIRRMSDQPFLSKA